eukprot:gnl/TRDRNA2_/TRDRNA2_189019_c0_seq1.p1 gnl/TRDRNA2_/TRDRNA2_189019_c0~~gnl/TRDRNA2_/TRDRNA2_189019_c0_seq1.p1  ORF type:complete len:141 (+),score=17.36 gnl/TRDRNA2_/TRDRNA2_189019_c0_seq1:101-523(+)
MGAVCEPCALAAAERSGSTIRLYHGTDRACAESIAAGGFARSPCGMLGPGVYMTSSFAKAANFGDTVLECDVDLGSVKRLTAPGPKWQATHDTGWAPAGAFGIKRSELCIKDPSRLTVCKIHKNARSDPSAKVGAACPLM